MAFSDKSRSAALVAQTKTSDATTGIASEKRERSKAAIGKEKQKVAAQSEMENGKFSYLLAYLGHVASRQHFQVRS